MTYNVWATPLKLPFPDFGPPLYTAGSSKRDIFNRAMTQTIGLKPEGCILTNDNWCGFTPETYSDEKSCWDVSCLDLILCNPAADLT